MLLNKKIILSLTIGLLLSGIALYLTFRNIPLHELVSYLKTVNYWWVVPAVAVALMSFLIRVLRWQLLLHPVKKTGFWSAFHPLIYQGAKIWCLCLHLDSYRYISRLYCLKKLRMAEYFMK